MSRSTIVRLELLLMAGVLLLLAYRVVEGPPAPAGVVVHADISPERLMHGAFAANQPVRLSVEATGSFESSDADAGLAAYGWILRRDDRSVVWSMLDSDLQRERETLAQVRDSVDVTAGTYDVYYASFGNRSDSRFGMSFLDRLLGDDDAWRGDADRWRMIVRAENRVGIRALDTESSESASPAGPGMLWSTAPMEGNKAEDFVFRTTLPVDLRMYAVGEIDRESMDYGWIEDAITGDRVWQMTRENTEPAGGWDANRLFRGSIQLPAGIYRAFFETDPRQDFSDWLGNPPFDPAGWGLTLFTDAENAVVPFDPWSSQVPFVQIDRVGDDERRSVQFRVREPLQVAAFGLGELGENGRYDYGWIQNNESQATIWEMTAERSQPAGGRNNRKELAFLTLPPSTYTLTYETDDSHSYDSWRHGRPDHPERWGVTLFSVDGEVDSSVVTVLEGARMDLADRGRRDRDRPPLTNLPRFGDEGDVIVDLTRLGNDMRVSRSFTLEDDAVLHVRGTGEISLSDPYDYGWIEEDENGGIVWQMTWQNTVPAGGADKNRVFDGTLSLGPGAYTAHFKTDFSHAYGDFGDDAPRDPSSWGLTVVRPEPMPQ